MHRPSGNYDPATQNRWKSSISLSFDPSQRENMTPEEERIVASLVHRQAADPNAQKMGKMATSTPFEFVPDEEVRKLAARVYACRQQMGCSSISFGDDGGESKLDPRKAHPPHIRHAYPSGQNFGAEHLLQVEKGIVAENSPKFDKQKERSYPGEHNMGRANVTTGLVPPPYPHPKVTTKMGEEHLSKSFEPPAYTPPDTVPRSNLGKSSLETGLVPPPHKSIDALARTQMCTESAPPDLTVPPGPPAPWLASEMHKPLGPAPRRPSYPHAQAFGHENRSAGVEVVPPKIKACYPALPTTKLNEGHKMGASHLEAHPLVAVEPPAPHLRGSHGKVMGHTSEAAEPVRVVTKMGQSSIKLG